MAADHSFGARPNSAHFAIGLVLSFLINRALVSALWSQTESFRPVLLTICLCVVILTLLIAAGKPVLRNMKPQSTPQPSS